MLSDSHFVPVYCAYIYYRHPTEQNLFVHFNKIIDPYQTRKRQLNVYIQQESRKPAIEQSEIIYNIINVKMLSITIENFKSFVLPSSH